ncbi:hypothetical protein OAP56_00215 [Rickettsiaceae bacterium]|nr:hypothetical protein [Rickettsiaceae bacterium]
MVMITAPLCIWIVASLLATYFFCKNTDFKKISMWRFIAASLWFFISGHLSLMLFFGWEHLYLLPFLPFGASTLARWYASDASGFLGGLLASFLFLPSIYHLLVKPIRKNLKLLGIFLSLCWSALFYSGGAMFLYVLSWNIF